MTLPLFIKEYSILATLIFIGTIIFHIFFKDKIFLRYGLLLFLILTAAYFARDFFLFIFIALLIIGIEINKKPVIDKVAIYFLFLFFLPLDFQQLIPIPGLQQFFTLNLPRALSIFILFPIFFSYFSQPQKTLLSQPVDKYVMLYFMYIFFLAFRSLTFTNSFRSGFIFFIDYILLYFVVTRTVHDISHFEKLLKPLVFVGFIFSMVAILETVKQWHMYEGLLEICKISPVQKYAIRGGFLRAHGPNMNTIGFGIYLYIMTALLGLFNYATHRIKNIYFFFGAIIMSFGICCTFSRGAWVGAFICLSIFYFSNKGSVAKVIPIAIVIAFLIMVSPLGDTIITSLPFVGTKFQGSVNYRVVLWQHALEAMHKSPLFGDPFYSEEPEIKELARLGGGIKGGRESDIVNSYAQIMLGYGLIGIMLIITLFFYTFFQIRKGIQAARDAPTVTLGHIFMAIFIAFLISIFTVSLVDPVPRCLWLIIALGNGYFYMVKKMNMQPSKA